VNAAAPSPVPVPVPVVVQGLGLLGRVAIDLSADTPGVELVGVITRRPTAATGLAPQLAVLPDLAAAGHAFPGALVLSTVHAIGEELERALSEAASAGLDVVTSSGLFHPPTQLADGGTALDALARAHAVRVLASGVQPGFVLDVLPSVVLDLAPGWTSVDVVKPSDARAWPVTTRHMLGMGELPGVVESSVPYPLAASAHLIARAVGRAVLRIEETRTAVTTDRDLVLADETIPSGHAVGFAQECVADLKGGRTVRVRWKPTLDVHDGLDLSLRLEATGAATLSLRLDGSFREDPYPATAARMLHAAVRARSLPPGLHLAIDLGLAWPQLSSED
jgi:2,4-diaminopentanoate dehydrogenase